MNGSVERSAWQRTPPATGRDPLAKQTNPPSPRCGIDASRDSFSRGSGSINCFRPYFRSLVNTHDVLLGAKGGAVERAVDFNQARSLKSTIAASTETVQHLLCA